MAIALIGDLLHNQCCDVKRRIARTRRNTEPRHRDASNPTAMIRVSDLGCVEEHVKLLSSDMGLTEG